MYNTSCTIVDMYGESYGKFENTDLDNTILFEYKYFLYDIV